MISSMEIEEDHSKHPEMQSGEDEAAEEDSFDSLHLQHAGEEEEEDSSDSSSIAYDYHQTSKRCKTLWGRLCSGAPTLALTRGTELQTSLSSENPSFILQMQESHVTNKFVLDVPAEFCKLHLSTHNVEVTLEDENGESYSVNFHPGTVQNLITGWKKFAVAHKLLEDDVIVFHLLRPCLFKVYIIRANEPPTVGCANPTNNNVHANEGNKERNSEANDKEVCALAPNLDVVKEGAKRGSLLSNPNLEPGQDHSSTDEFHSSDMKDAFPLSKCDADSEGRKRQDNVGVLVREEKEEDLSNSSGMVTLKPPSVENNVAVCSKRVLRLSRKKTYKQVDYENQQMIKRFPTKRRSTDSEPCTLALEIAKERQRNLSSEHPSFIKKMHQFNVIEGKLILPLEFCRLHLPNHDAEVTLEDENGEIYKVNFRPKSGMRFCGGWMRFSAAHNLAEGDVLVFHLLRPCCLKVYIIRVSNLIGSTDLTNSNVNANKGKKRKYEAADRNGPRLAPHLDTDQGNVKRCSLLSNPSLEHGLDHSSRGEFHSSDMEASSSSKHDADNLEVQAREEKEKDSSNSSCMVTSKPPSVENNIPVSNKGVSRISRKKTHKKVAYANRQTIKRWLTKRRRMDSETCALVLERAKELQTNLSSEHPSFIKHMHLSDVTIKRTMLAIPLEFYKLHLPNHDAEVTLEDEHGESYIVKFVSTYRPRFIGGWKRFLDAHKLLASDIVVFHLLRPCYFKVYIVRVGDLIGSTDLTNSNVNANKGKKKRKCEAADRKSPGLAPHLDTDQGIVKRCSLLSSPSLEPGLDHLSRDEKEKDSLASSCVVTSKPPSVENNIPVSSRGISKLSSKKTHEEAAYVNQQTIKSGLTKRQLALALEREKELQTNMSSEHPSFIKQMHPSNVTGRAVLAVPTEFYRLHLPNHDAEVTLEDENGESYIVKFSTTSRGRFCGGWKRFTDAHKLLASDTVVFHLLRPCYFKVYIVRANDPTVVGSTNLPSSNVNSNKGKNKRKCEAADRKIPHLDTDQGSLKKCSLLSSNPSLEPGLLDHSSTKKSQSSSDIEACTFSGNDSDFENFKIIVNGEIVDDPELPRSIRFKYYQLCCSQKSFLHEHLVKYANSALAAGIITGTLKVAEAIRSCKLSTSKDDFAMWDSTLEGFKSLGMEVGFLRQRLKGLAGFESEFRETEKFKRYVEVKKKMRRIKRKFLELKRTTKKLEDEAKDEMKVDIHECMHSFQRKANASW